MKKRHLLSLLALGISMACYSETYPAPIGPSQSDFSGIGLLQTPTTHMAQEGELSLNYHNNNQYHYYSASVQLFPWLETTLHYTNMHTQQYSSIKAFSGNQTYKDKAFNLKLHLWEESYWLPQVAVGAQDISSTGLFDTEYLVASKAWGPFNFTLSLGWGYLGTSSNVKNPLCSASDKYCYHNNSYKQAGSINSSQMFHSPASLFGSMEYQTPWQPLHLKLEYEGNNYQQDFARKLEQKSKFNISAIYHVTNWANINLSYEHGNTFMFGVTLHTNFNNLHPSYNNNTHPQYQPQPQDAILQHSVVANQLTLLKYNAGLANPQIQAKGNTLYVTSKQVKYHDSHKGIIHANQIMMNNLPDGIKTIHITENHLNMPQATTETNVASLKNHLAREPLGHKTTLAQKHIKPVVPQSTKQGWYINKSHFDFHINPVLNQSVSGPENFYMYQLGMMGTADLWLTDHLLTTSSLFANLANNYNKFNYTNPPQDSHLPHMHTHVHEYVQNNVYVNNLQANYFQHLGNSFYSQVYSGYLKTMFGSAGAEVLYHPLDSNWAFGLDANYIKQHNWHSAKDMMKFTNYSMKTRHLTTYWTPSFTQDVLVKASIRQYLAGDKGSTLEITKHFDSSVVVGGYATITNVSKEEYSKGDFTKGMYVSVPLDLFSSGPTHSHAAIGWTPLTHDSGQQLGHKFQLYDMTSDHSINFH